MATDSDLGEMLVRWDECRQQGRDITPEELCAENPQLLSALKRLIQAVESKERAKPAGEATVDSKPSQPSASETMSQPAPTPAPEDLHIPGYEILGLIDQGGMGIVYKARQVQLKRTVALKMVRTESLAGSQRLARFRVEAEAVARLQHPNIVQIYDVGESEGRPYFSMEFVEGGSLAQQAAGRPLPPRQSAELVAQLAEATHFAHQRGIIHRDLKPANILLTGIRDQESGVRNQGSGARNQKSQVETQDSKVGAQKPAETSPTPEPWPLNPVPKITDFGLAKRFDVDSGITVVGGQTQTGVVLGTPSYMAPEQAAGKTREVGPLADVYALGAILYEALTGRPPFKGETPMETLLQVMSSDPVPPSKLQPKVSRDLETICLKCLEKSPGRRYASAAELADDLHRFLDGQPIAARKISYARRAWKWARRRPEAAALAVVFVAGVLGVIGRFGWVWYQEQQEPRVTAVRLAPRAREILHYYCYSCHGQDPENQKGDFDVLDHAGLLNSPQALVVPGDPAASLLIHRIGDNSMPPEEEEEFPRIGSEEIEVLKKWVAGGAPPFEAPGPEDQPGPDQAPTPASTQVKEIFRNKCYECHRHGRAKNGIKILNHDLLLAKRKVVVPGDPDNSRLFQVLFEKDPKKVMPPPKRPQLTSVEISTIQRWILQGAQPFPREHKARQTGDSP